MHLTVQSYELYQINKQKNIHKLTTVVGNVLTCISRNCGSNRNKNSMIWMSWKYNLNSTHISKKKKNQPKTENTFFLNIPGTFTTGDMY